MYIFYLCFTNILNYQLCFLTIIDERSVKELISMRLFSSTYQTDFENTMRTKVLTGVLLLAFFTTGIVSFSIINPIKTLAVATNVSLSERVGTTHAGGLYNFTTKNYLAEGADRVLDMGGRTIKLWFTPNYATDYPFNTSSWGTVNTMVQLAQTSYFDDVFSKDFKTIVLEAFEFGGINYRDGLNTTEAQSVEDQFYYLTKHLMQTYSGSNKTFILQNWEGDNALLLSALSTQTEKDTAIQGMIDWLNKRQSGINIARNELGNTGVNVYGAAEVNRVSTSDGQAKIIDVVIPYTYMDLYSYSNWETGTDDGLLWDNLTYIAKQSRSSAAFGEKNVYLGEFGVDEYTAGSEANQYNQTKIQLETALAWGVPYALYWELYCNQQRQTYSGRPTNSDLRGFWLIKPDGTYTQTYNYLKTIFQQSMIYDHLDNWNNAFSHTSKLSFDTSNLSYVDYDDSRAIRTTNTTQSIVYYSGASNKDITTFKVGINYYNLITGKFKAYSSPNNSSYTEIALTGSCSKTISDPWKRVVYSPTNPLPFGTKYIKYSMMSDTNTWNPQISRTIVYTADINTFTDNLNNLDSAYSKTQNWAIDSGNSTYFNGDTGRAARTSDTSEDLIYRQDALYDFNLKVYYYQNISGRVKIYSSTDALSWTLLSHTTSAATATSGGWYYVFLTSPSSRVPYGTNYIKIKFESDSNIWTPQLANVEIKSMANTRSFITVDNLDNWSNAYYSTSGNLSFDTANPTLMEGDASRAYRSSNADSYLTYHLDNIQSFSIKVNYYSSVADRIKVYTSSDNATWNEVSIVNNETVNTSSGGSWNRTVFTEAGCLPVGTNYICIYISGNDPSNYWAQQIGAVRLYN